MSEVNITEINDIIESAKKEELILKHKNYLDDLRNNSSNKKSKWLDFIAFFVPVYGIFAVFFYLFKFPKRAKGLIKITILSLILQFSFLVFCYLFLFNILGDLLIILFG